MKLLIKAKAEFIFIAQINEKQFKVLYIDVKSSKNNTTKQKEKSKNLKMHE